MTIYNVNDTVCTMVYFYRKQECGSMALPNQSVPIPIYVVNKKYYHIIITQLFPHHHSAISTLCMIEIEIDTVQIQIQRETDRGKSGVDGGCVRVLNKSLHLRLFN